MRNIYILLLTFLLVQTALSQSYLGYAESNYSGLISNKYNPANIVDSRFKYDINIFSGNLTAVNNYFYLSSLSTGKHKSLSDNEDVKANGMLTLDFGFMYEINDKIGIGFSMSPGVRFVINELSEGGISELFDFYKTGFKESTLTNEDTDATALVWNEYNFNYGQVILDRDEHFLKGGIELKILQGLGGYKTKVESLSYDYDYYEKEEFTNATGSVDIVFSEGVDPDDVTTIFDESNFGLGFNIGFVYEWRPNWKSYKNTTGSEHKWQKDKNKYKVKFGVSVVDIGSVNFDIGSSSTSYTLKDSTFSSKDVLHEIGASFGNQNSEDFRIIDPRDLPESIRLQLPAKLNLFVDYNIWKNYYVSALSSISLISQSNINAVSDYNYYSISPRYETANFDVSLPINYNQLGGFNVGVSTRYKGFFIGSSNLSSMLFSSNITGANFYFGFRFSGYHRASK